MYSIEQSDTVKYHSQWPNSSSKMIDLTSFIFKAVCVLKTSLKWQTVNFPKWFLVSGYREQNKRGSQVECHQNHTLFNVFSYHHNTQKKKNYFHEHAIHL